MHTSLGDLWGEELCNAVAITCANLGKTFEWNIQALQAAHEEEIEGVKTNRWECLKYHIPEHILLQLGVSRETGAPDDFSVAKYLSQCEIPQYSTTESVKGKEKEMLSLSNIKMDTNPSVRHSEDYDIVEVECKNPDKRQRSNSSSPPTYFFGDKETCSEDDKKYILVKSIVSPVRDICRITPSLDEFYTLDTTQFKEGGWAACTTISFVAIYYLCYKSSKDDIIGMIKWKMIMTYGKTMYDIWKMGPIGQSRKDSHTSLDDLMNMKGLKPLFDDMGKITTLYGPLYYDQTLEFSEEDKKEWVPLVDVLREFMKKGKEKISVGVLTINGYTISLWTDGQYIGIFDSHGSGTPRKATLDFMTRLYNIYKRCLQLTRCSLFWKGEGGSNTSDQYTFYAIW